MHAPDLVVPKPLPQVTPRILQANWRDRVTLSTRWLTDRVEAAGSLSEDRRGLSYRPVRTQTVTLSGLSKDEVNQLQANLRLCSAQPCPVPLYSDAVLLKAEANGTWLSCTPTYRRFFPGARVVIVHPGRDSDPFSYGYEQYRTIKEVKPDGLLLNETLAPATMPVGSTIFPCIDAEVGFEFRGNLLTDSIFEVEFTAEEIIGQSTLPPIWRGPITPFHVTAGDASSTFPAFEPAGASPILDTKDFLPQWRDGVQFEIFRKGRSRRLGRGSAIDQVGDVPQVRFSWDMLQLNRYEGFKVQALFDAMQGRKSSFWVIDPVQAWEWQSTIGTPINGVVVRMSGNEEHLQTLKYVYVRTDVPSQPVYIAPVASYQRNGLDTIISFEAGYEIPDQGFDLTIGPAYRMAFESDELREDWTVDTVFSTAISAVEVLNERAVSLSNLRDIRETTHLSQPPASVDSLQFWFEASNNCFQKMPRQDSSITSGPIDLQRASAWPAVRDIPNVWVDSRANLDDRIPLLEQKRLPQAYLLKGDTPPSVRTPLIGKYSSKLLTWGASFITNCSFDPAWLGTTSAEFEGTPAHLRLPWTADGWTLFVAASGGVTDLANVDPLADVSILSIKDSAGRKLFEWVDRGVDSGASTTSERYRGRAVFYSLTGTALNSVRPRSFYGNQVGAQSYPKGPIVAVLRASPTTGLQMWFNGSQFSASDATSLWNDSTPVNFLTPILPTSQDRWFNAFNDQILGFGYTDTTLVNPDKDYGTFPGLMAAVSYRRALDLEEINIVGKHLASSHAATWEEIL